MNSLKVKLKNIDAQAAETWSLYMTENAMHAVIKQTNLKEPILSCDGYTTENKLAVTYTIFPHLTLDTVKAICISDLDIFITALPT